MKATDYTVNVSVKAIPAEVFKSINNVAGWWTQDLEGQTQKLNDVFTVTFGETFITLKVVELIPESKIRWHVTDCYKHWLKDKKEWKDTEVVWDITRSKNETQIHFTHLGLVPGIECYEGCEKAWNFYVQESLFNLLTTGTGIPELK
jgi:hypothetical protein